MKRRILFLRGLLAACLTLLLVLAGGCGNEAGTPRAAENGGVRTVRIAYLPITHALPLFAEQGAALTDEDGTPVKIELVKYSSWPELIDALNTGKVDGASVLIELAVKAREQGIDVRAAALGHHAGNIIVGGRDIQSVEDLRGKIFAIPHKQSSHKLLLDAMLAAHDMSEDDLTVVEMTPPEMPSGLAQGQIAGYCVAEPFGAKSVLLGTGHVLEDADALWPGNVCCALVFNGGFLRANHDLARAVTQGYAAAGEELTAHPEERAPLAKQHLKATGKVLALSLQWIAYDDLAITPAAYDDLVQRMQAIHLIEEAPAYDAFVDATLLAPSQPSSMTTSPTDSTERK